MAKSAGTRNGSARTGSGNEADAGEIARVAYELFEQRGREHGHDFEDWVEAERIVRQRRRGAGR